MLQYRVAFHLPGEPSGMVVAEALDFPGAMSQGFDLNDARTMIASAMQDLAECMIADSLPLPAPDPDVTADADLIELISLAAS